MFFNISYCVIISFYYFYYFIIIFIFIYYFFILFLLLFLLFGALCILFAYPFLYTKGYEPSPQALEYLQPALQLYESIVPKFDLGEIPETFIKLGFYPGVLQLCFAYAEYDACSLVPHFLPQNFGAMDPTNRALKINFTSITFSLTHSLFQALKAADTEGEPVQ
jgi:hypothetical protein